MTKRSISRTDLTEKALIAVRQEPGCQTVKEVSITPVEDAETGALDWNIAVPDPGAAKEDAAYHAAKRVKGRLAEKYLLRD